MMDDLCIYLIVFCCDSYDAMTFNHTETQLTKWIWKITRNGSAHEVWHIILPNNGGIERETLADWSTE